MIQEVLPPELRTVETNVEVVQFLLDNVASLSSPILKLRAETSWARSFLLAYTRGVWGWTHRAVLEGRGPILKPSKDALRIVSLRSLARAQRVDMSPENKDSEGPKLADMVEKPHLLVVTLGASDGWGKSALLEAIDIRLARRDSKRTWLIEDPSCLFDADQKAWSEEFDDAVECDGVVLAPAGVPARPARATTAPVAPKAELPRKPARKASVAWQVARVPGRCSACESGIDSGDKFTFDMSSPGSKLRLCERCGGAA